MEKESWKRSMLLLDTPSVNPLNRTSCPAVEGVWRGKRASQH